MGLPLIQLSCLLTASASEYRAYEQFIERPDVTTNFLNQNQERIFDSGYVKDNRWVRDAQRDIPGRVLITTLSNQKFGVNYFIIFERFRV